MISFLGDLCLKWTLMCSQDLDLREEQDTQGGGKSMYTGVESRSLVTLTGNCGVSRSKPPAGGFFFAWSKESEKK